VSRHDFLPFGEELTTNNRTSALGYGVTDNVMHKYTAKERDPESGLDYFGARYFSGAQGRFTSPDPYEIVVQKSKGKTPQEQVSLLNSFISNPPSMEQVRLWFEQSA
jgi:RHS repeat-associated protein